MFIDPKTDQNGFLEISAQNALGKELNFLWIHPQWPQLSTPLWSTDRVGPEKMPGLPSCAAQLNSWAFEEPKPQNPKIVFKD